MINRYREPTIINTMAATDISGGVHSLYVYCDVLENVPVGDTEAP